MANPVRRTLLSVAAEVNATAICDKCRGTYFKVGLQWRGENTNFIKVLECVECGHQLLVTHRSDAGLRPSVAQG